MYNLGEFYLGNCLLSVSRKCTDVWLYEDNQIKIEYKKFSRDGKDIIRILNKSVKPEMFISIQSHEDYKTGMKIPYLSCYNIKIEPDNYPYNMETEYLISWR